MALTLALNAAEGRLQFTVSRAGELLAAQEWHAPSNGVELLVPALERAFSLASLNISEIERIACVNGPGSFTGLRLALATASGLARGISAQREQAATPVFMAGIPYLELLAASCPLAQGSGLWVLTHARRGLVHMQGFLFESTGCPIAATPVLVEDISGAARRLAEPLSANSMNFAVGSGLSRNAELFAKAWNAAPPVHLLPAWANQPACAALARLAESADYALHDVAPLYIRPSDAEAQLPDIARRLGHNPEESVRRLAAATGESEE